MYPHILSLFIVSDMMRKLLKPNLWSLIGLHWKRYEKYNIIRIVLIGFQMTDSHKFSSIRKWIISTFLSLSCKPASVDWRIRLLCPNRCMAPWVCRIALCLCLFQQCSNESFISQWPKLVCVCVCVCLCVCVCMCVCMCVRKWKRWGTLWLVVWSQQCLSQWITQPRHRIWPQRWLKSKLTMRSWLNAGKQDALLSVQDSVRSICSLISKLY